jgi:EKC/KEOPS complex subunit PCC1/LAGE3
MATTQLSDTEFPYSLYDPTPTFGACQSISGAHHQLYCDTDTVNRTISLPLPTHRLASSALQTLEVDTELSPFVRRTFTLTSPSSDNPSEPQEKKQKQDPDESKTVLQTTYRATTNRMLRVAVNGFMESLGVVLGVMAELDVDVLKAEEIEG